MNKRIIVVLAAMCMIYGSALIPTAERDGEPVQQVTSKLNFEPIRPVPVKEENNGSYDSQRIMELTAGELPEEPDGDSSGGEQSSDSGASGAGGQDGGDSEPSGEVPAEFIEGTEGAEQEPEEPDPGDPPLIGEDEIAPEPEYLGDWTVTAYCSCALCCGEQDMETASGRSPIAGHTAACNILPFYTRILIDGIEYEVEDTGYTEYGDYWIDIYFDTHEEALAYGVQTREIYLVR